MKNFIDEHIRYDVTSFVKDAIDKKLIKETDIQNYYKDYNGLSLEYLITLHSDVLYDLDIEELNIHETPERIEAVKKLKDDIRDIEDTKVYEPFVKKWYAIEEYLYFELTDYEEPLYNGKYGIFWGCSCLFVEDNTILKKIYESTHKNNDLYKNISDENDKEIPYKYLGASQTILTEDTSEDKGERRC